MRKLTCFVIMPSVKNPPTRLVPDKEDGWSAAASSQPEHVDEFKVEFSKVFKGIVQKAVQQVNTSPREAEIECHNSDTLPGGGFVISNFVKAICCADITITDLTGFDPNVLFELGIRLSVRDSLNLLLLHKDVILPFDIKSQGCIYYALDIDSGDTAADEIAKKIQEAMPALLANTPNTAENMFRRTVDAATGRHLEQKLAEVFAPSAELTAELVNEVQRLGGANPKLRDRGWNFLAVLAETFLTNALGRERAIEIYRLLTTLEGFREKRRDAYYKLNEICAEDPDRQEEAQRYLEQAKALEA